MCISWTIKGSDIIDARYNHEDYTPESFEATLLVIETYIFVYFNKYVNPKHVFSYRII